LKIYKPQYVLAIDPSGSYNEGKGITGWALYEIATDSIIQCGEIKASKNDSQLEFWEAVLILIDNVRNTYKRTVISVEDFILYKSKASALIDSSLETSQLIGAIKMHCYLYNLRLYMRPAVRVMQRWTDDILVHKGYISNIGKSYYINCYKSALSDHIKDAIRHAVHCATFEL
jgi:Holliday junction resolvasome RuvABC endonuclease subunit